MFEISAPSVNTLFQSSSIFPCNVGGTGQIQVSSGTSGNAPLTPVKVVDPLNPDCTALVSDTLYLFVIYATNGVATVNSGWTETTKENGSECAYQIGTGNKSLTVTQGTAGRIDASGVSLSLPASISPCTVTGTFQDGVGNPPANAFVRFRLRNYSGSVPRILGSTVVVETQVDVSIDPATGLLSTSLWGNDSLSPAGTFYTVEYFNKGKITSQFNIRVVCPTDLNTVQPI